MELVEFHIGHPAACPPSHGNAIAAGTVRVAAIKINLTCTTGGQNNYFGLEYVNIVTVVIEHIGAAAAQLARVGIGLGYQVNRYMIFKYVDV